MAKVNLVTQSAYAAHRGVSEAAVSKAVSAGRISLIDGKIDPAVADIQWKANSRARAANSPPADLLSASAEPDLTQKPQPSKDASDSGNDDYWASRGRREAAEAELAELRLAEQQGSTIRVDAVKQALTNAFTATRDSLLQIPSRLSAVLAAETDAAKVHELLQGELYRALEGMAAVQSSNRLAGREQAQ